jgi:hypothetical protein
MAQSSAGAGAPADDCSERQRRQEKKKMLYLLINDPKASKMIPFR